MSMTPEKIGKYRVVREVGKGATATVYLCEGGDYPEGVAVKLIQFGDKNRDEGKWSRRQMKLLTTESAVAKRLDHPNIIKFHEVVIEETQAYIVMEFVDGQPLDQFCSFDKMLPIHRTVSIVFKCCLALDYAYRQGVVHRDIKPANIMVDHQDNVKITDFGLALNVNKKSHHDSTFIMGVGSPAYMSPEQIKSYPLNQKTDLYSLGVVLFHLLTGRLPFRAKHPAQLVYKIINADPPSVSQLNPDIPEQMDLIIRKALEKDLYSRYKNGADMAKDLSAVRYKILDENYVAPDMTRFTALRKLPFFTEFEDVEVWETMRISAWLDIEPGATLMREGDIDSRFSIVLEGEVEVSSGGKRLTVMGPGDVVGEAAYLDAFEHKRHISAVALTKLTCLEVNPAALQLASEECLEHFRERLVTIASRRLAAAEKKLAASGESVQFTPKADKISALDLQLVDAPPRR
ncbi:MAG: protein kinase [Sterolibacteriaceae bacterium]|uniref:non-specific serine/threonine protein kinase n=1 Tax=Candidatus Methylophosphatis roskildensis TaxID=2899263 RepID=A0A9D7HP11_9PROT|nr:protein kinase [Candidatus Methylophosphatis roskildensis]MBK7235415.1 protein kinase [Sterolibacteriaceae bacterium]